MDRENFNVVTRTHGEVLKDKYGEIHADVLYQDEWVREAHLRDDLDICRTYAISFLCPLEGEEILAIDKKIRAGNMIGAAFKEEGEGENKWEIRKNVQAVEVMVIPDWLQDEMDLKVSEGKARYSEFYAKKEGMAPVLYATVLELYSPDFRTADSIDQTDLDQVAAPTDSLIDQGFTMEEIWRRIAEGWDDVKERLSVAQQDGQTELHVYRQQVADMMARPHPKKMFRKEGPSRP
ncbi:MAG: hypothetical protein WCO52_02540 [bacterium]